MELLDVRKVVKLELIIKRLDGKGGQGNCNHAQLLKHIISISNDLKDDEMEILKNSSIWPKENLTDSHIYNTYRRRKVKCDSDVESGGMNPKERFIARDLYIPSILHRELGLPIIDWKGWLSSSSKEGKFLITLGLQEYPALKKILELAAPPTNPKIREKVLKYFIDNFEKNYSKYYEPSEINIEFLPCSNSNIYAKPLECFISPECTIMKFKAIRQDLKFQVEKIGVRQHPDYSELLNRLTEDLPQNKDKAKEIFEYLASQQGNFIASNWNTLADLKFIPIHNKTQPNTIIHKNPHNCFFSVQEEILKDFFTCIDFGEKANKFLQNCGVKNEPSLVDFAELLVQSSHKLWDSINSIGKTEDNTQIYLSILRRIAIDFKKILTSKSNLIESMKTTPILVAIEKKNDANYSHLASAKEIYINDDIVYQKIFNPLTAPEEELFDTLYKELGCKSLQKSVRETSTPKGIARQTKKSKQLQELIRERASLFYYECPESNIKKDEKWLQSLNVKEIDYVETIYMLKNIRKTEKNDTTILQDRRTNSWTLYITTKSDLLDISQQIVKNIYRLYKWKDVFCINTLLTTSISSLKDRGYPVNRILQQQKYQQSIAINQRNLQDCLQNSIESCNNNEHTTYESYIDSYCDGITVDDVFYVGIVQEIKVYDIKGNTFQSGILCQTSPLNRFIKMLKDVAGIFGLQSNVIHVFYGGTKVIAFNQNRKLFFNLRYYHELHDRTCIIKPTIDAMGYWFMTFCHELAHNFVKSHNAEHENYFSSFAEMHMSKFVALVNGN